MTSASLTLPSEPASVRAARDFATGTLSGWGMPEAAEAARLLVSELATNAVLHARTAFTVELARSGDAVRVCLLDHSPALPRPRRYGLDSTTGRGLRMLDSMSSCWGADRADGGKVVWFELPVDGRVPEDTASWDDGVDAEALLASFGDDDDDAVRVRAGRGARARWAA